MDGEIKHLEAAESFEDYCKRVGKERNMSPQQVFQRLAKIGLVVAKTVGDGGGAFIQTTDGKIKRIIPFKKDEPSNS